MTAYGDFAGLILQGLGIGVRQEALIGLVAWMGAESSFDGSDRHAAFNALNTTQPWPGCTDFNSVGVKNYPSLSVGVQATVTTIQNGRYPHVIAALQGRSAEDLAHAVGASPWGTPDFTSLVATVRGDYARYASTHLSGSPAGPSQIGVAPMFSPPIAVVALCAFEHPTLGPSAAAVASDGAVFCSPANAYLGGANGRKFFSGRAAAVIEAAAGGYTIIDTAGERYQFPTDVP